MYLLSVIVPVYNAAKYLDECLSHLVKMGDRVQIILADDESSDSSYTICEEYASNHKNIILLQEENGGPSKARNLALNSATGKYVVFCDADDWLDERIIDVLEKYENDNYDFFQFCVNDEYDLLYDRESLLNEEQKKELLAFIVGLRDNRNLGHGYFGLITCKIFKRELLKKISFDPKVVGEDTLYAVQAFNKVDTVVFLPYKYYNYRIVDGSYSRKYFPNILPMALSMLEKMKASLPEDELLQRAFYCHVLDKFWWCLFASVKDKGNFKEVHSKLEELCSIQVFKEAIKKKAVHPNGFKSRLKYELLYARRLVLLALLISTRSK